MSDYWKDNGIEKPQAVVVCAACKSEDLILCSARHWDKTMRRQLEVINAQDIEGLSLTLKAKHFTQGFINQFGEFMTRKEAMKVAIDAGQKVDIKRGCGGNKERLYSEGLY